MHRTTLLAAKSFDYEHEHEKSQQTPGKDTTAKLQSKTEPHSNFRGFAASRVTNILQVV